MDMLSRLVQQASLQNASPVEQMMQLMENAKRNAAAEKTAPILPMQHIDPHTMSLQIGIQREGFDSNSRDKDKKLQIRQTFIGNAPNFLYLKDMKIRKRHEGRYLLCRTITPPTRMVGVSVGIEDPNGWAQSMTIYNFPGTFDASGNELDTLFPLHTILAIREPWAKMALAGNHAQIRIDSPSDIVTLAPEDPVLNDVNWVNGGRTSRVVTTSSAEWKSVGDNHFKQKQYFAAAVAYSYALEKDPSSVAVRLNRCFAHIRLSNFSFALHDAETVLQAPELQSADRIKALYRAALAQYGAGKYEESQGYYRECLSIDSDLKDAIIGIEKCGIRIQEREKGTYDWVHLLRQREIPCARPDVADYSGPVKVSPLGHRGGGRGIVATSDIKPGEVLFVSKALAVSFPKEFERLGTLYALNLLTNTIEMGTQYDVLQQTIAKIAANDHLSTPLLQLYAGTDPDEPKLEPSSLNDPATIGNPMKFTTDIDVGRIEAILSFNSFGIKESGEVRWEEQPESDKASALYTHPSFINHSCIGNAKRETFGHVMVIRAVQDILAGEEIMISYCGHEASYPERKQALSKYFEECDCSLCVSDRAAGLTFHETLVKLDKQAYRTNNTLSLKQFRALVNKIDSLYPPSYPAYRPISYRAHHRLGDELNFALAEAIESAPLEKLCQEAIQQEIIALEALGFQITDKETKKARPTDKKTIKLPISLNRSPYNSLAVCMSCWMIVVSFLAVGNEWRAEMWLRAAIWFEDKSLGGGIPLFRRRYAKGLETFGPDAQALLKRIERSP